MGGQGSSSSSSSSSRPWTTQPLLAAHHPGTRRPRRPTLPPRIAAAAAAPPLPLPLPLPLRPRPPWPWPLEAQAQRPTLRKLGDHAEVVLGLKGVQHGDDVGVLQLAQDLNLLQAAAAAAAAHGSQRSTGWRRQQRGSRRCYGNRRMRQHGICPACCTSAAREPNQPRGCARQWGCRCRQHAAAARAGPHLAQVAQVLLVLAMLGDQLDGHRLQAAGAPRLPHLRPGSKGSPARHRGQHARACVHLGPAADAGALTWPRRRTLPKLPSPASSISLYSPIRFWPGILRAGQSSGRQARRLDEAAAAAAARRQPRGPLAAAGRSAQSMLRLVQAARWAEQGSLGGLRGPPARLDVPCRDHSRMSHSPAPHRSPRDAGLRPVKLLPLLAPRLGLRLLPT